MEKIRPDEWGGRGAKSGGSSVEVKQSGAVAFRLRLDGSVEKVTVSRLALSFCKMHAHWIIETHLEESDEDE